MIILHSILPFFHPGQRSGADISQNYLLYYLHSDAFVDEASTLKPFSRLQRRLCKQLIRNIYHESVQENL